MYTLSRYLQTNAYRRLSDRQLRTEARAAPGAPVERQIEAAAWWRSSASGSACDDRIEPLVAASSTSCRAPLAATHGDSRRR